MVSTACSSRGLPEMIYQAADGSALLYRLVAYFSNRGPAIGRLNRVVSRITRFYSAACGFRVNSGVGSQRPYQNTQPSLAPTRLLFVYRSTRFGSEKLNDRLSKNRSTVRQR